MSKNLLKQLGAHSAARAVFEVIHRRPARSWLGHYAHFGFVLLYCVGSALFGAGVLFRHSGPYVTSLITAVAAFGLYLYVVYWWVVVWAVHTLDECVRCESATMMRRYTESRAPVWRFRGYHLIAEPGVWVVFQAVEAVALGFAVDGGWLHVLVLLPVLAVLAAVWWLTDFHVRCGFACFRCRGMSGPGRWVSFVPNRTGVSR
jgi:hypothetical protein